jgi:hypothetical protein
VSIKYPNIIHCKALQKFTQIWIFGLKTNHLATLISSTIFFQFIRGSFLGQIYENQDHPTGHDAFVISLHLRQGCQIFLGTTYQNGKEIYQIIIKYTNRPQNVPRSHKIDQMAN